MASVNKQTIVGRLGKDPEVKQGQNQPESGRSNAYCFVGIATDDAVGKNPDGTWKMETTWHNVNVFGQQAEYLGKYGKKGSWVYIEGRTQHKKDEKTGGYFTNVIASHVIVFGKDSEPNAEQKTEQKTEQVDRGAARATTQATHAPAPAPQAQTTSAATGVATAPAGTDTDALDLPF